MDIPNWISRALPPSNTPVGRRARVTRMSVGPGGGGDCAYCHKQIKSEDVEYELDAYVAAALQTLHFHRICFHLWEELP